MRILMLVTAAAGLALPPKLRGVRADRWKFDILTRVKHENKVEIVAVDKRGEVGWFEVLRARAGNPPLHANLPDEPAVDRAFGRDIMVDAQCRRRGVGEALMRAAEDVVRDWKLSELVLSCVKGHEPSYNLYRKLGFEEVKADLAKDSESVMLRKFVPTATPTE
mmetsp:Transcript_5104/g.15115  ORF Transcript_5104/g.15115 Transcript_5104/m.15115 type:complete len:164 (+) Transcript_5104:255-746(+)